MNLLGRGGCPCCGGGPPYCCCGGACTSQRSSSTQLRARITHLAIAVLLWWRCRILSIVVVLLWLLPIALLWWSWLCQRLHQSFIEHCTLTGRRSPAGADILAAEDHRIAAVAGGRRSPGCCGTAGPDTWWNASSGARRDVEAKSRGKHSYLSVVQRCAALQCARGEKWRNPRCEEREMERESVRVSTRRTAER